MSQTHNRLSEAMRLVQGAWTPMREAEGQRRLRGRLARRARTIRIAAGSVVLSLAAAAVVLVWMPTRPAVQGRGDEVVRLAKTLRFPDGSEAVATVDDTDLRVAEDTGTRQTVRILRGGARFDVAKVKGRIFRVELRHVVVEVLGTLFLVEEQGPDVRVAVERGRVRVYAGSQRVELGAGEAKRFSPIETPAEMPPLVPPTGESAPKKRTTTARPTRSHASRDSSSAQSPAPPREAHPVAPPAGSLREVENALPTSPPSSAVPAKEAAAPSAIVDPVGKLLADADVARRAGRAADAVARLRIVVERFSRDARASLAAFTAGLIELEEHNRPREAAGLFAAARRLDASGALAEDALAREAESWHRGGEQSKATERAVEYLHQYPNGRRLRSVRQFGNLP